MSTDLINTELTMRETEIVKIKENLEEQKEIISKFKEIYGLEENKAWILLKDLYFKDERDRIANAITGSEPLNGSTIVQLQEKLIAIRHFKIFIQTLEQNAADAVQLKEEFEKILVNLETGEYSFEDEETKGDE
jgi:hypothetical protein